MFVRCTALFVAAIRAILVAVATPYFADTLCVVATVLIRLTAMGAASHFVRAISAVQSTIAHVRFGDAFSVAACSLIVMTHLGFAGTWWLQFLYAQIDGELLTGRGRRITYSFADVGSSVFQLDVRDLQTSVDVSASMGQWEAVAAKPADPYSHRALVATLEDHFATFFDRLLAGVRLQVQVRRFYRRFAILFVGSVSALWNPVANGGSWDTVLVSDAHDEASGATSRHWIRRSTVIFVGAIGAVNIMIALLFRLDAVSVPALELILSTSSRTIRFVVLVKTVDPLVADS